MPASKHSSFQPADTSGLARYDTESFWGRDDNDLKSFADKKLYKEILAESLLPSEARKKCCMYCIQKDFSRPDRVCLVLFVLKKILH